MAPVVTPRFWRPRPRSGCLQETCRRPGSPPASGAWASGQALADGGVPLGLRREGLPAALTPEPRQLGLRTVDARGLREGTAVVWGHVLRGALSLQSPAALGFTATMQTPEPPKRAQGAQPGPGVSAVQVPATSEGRREPRMRVHSGVQLVPCPQRGQDRAVWGLFQGEWIPLGGPTPRT